MYIKATKIKIYQMFYHVLHQWENQVFILMLPYWEENMWHP